MEDDEALVPGVQTQTDLSGKDVSDLLNVKEENKMLPELRSQAKRLKEDNELLSKANAHLTEESAALLLNEGSFSSSDDEKVLCFTGLSSWELFSKLFTFVKPHLKQKSSLLPFQQLLMTLRDCA